MYFEIRNKILTKRLHTKGKSHGLPQGNSPESFSIGDPTSLPIRDPPVGQLLFEGQGFPY